MASHLAPFLPLRIPKTFAAICCLDCLVTRGISHPGFPSTPPLRPNSPLTQPTYQSPAPSRQPPTSGHKLTEGIKMPAWYLLTEESHGCLKVYQIRIICLDRRIQIYLPFYMDQNSGRIHLFVVSYF